jgi:2,3-bisphosphoglycerate-independent phosphoglycerate mutase
MVGHTGDFAATVRAVEVVDAALGRVVEAAREVGAVVVVTADHGNADEMFELDKRGAPIVVDGKPRPRTSHSLNPVPFIVVDPAGSWTLTDLVDPGIASVGATLLRLHGFEPPPHYLPALVQHAR